MNHHSGTWRYFLISFVCTSISFSCKADLLNRHVSLHITTTNQHESKPKPVAVQSSWISVQSTWSKSSLKDAQPPMEEGDMNNSGSKTGEVDTIIDSKESTKAERPFTVISIDIKTEVWVNYSRDIVVLASRGKQSIRKNGECLGIKEIKPICQWGHEVSDKSKASSNVGSGKPWTGKRAP